MDARGMSDLPEGGWPTKPPQTSSRLPRRFGWHHVYYLLATLNLATLALSLYQNHRILTIYRDSVSVDQEWDERIDSYSVLTHLAAAVNAPGNDVFASHDVERESARLEMARRQFEQASGAATASLRDHPEPAIAAPVLHGLERTAAAMGSMVTEAEAIFASFRRADPSQAGQRMAAMDHRYAEVRAALDEVRRGAREVQRRNLERQASAAVAHAANEYVIGTLILLLVAAVTAYGSRLARRVESDRRERERFLAQLQEAEAQTRAIFDAAADGIITVDERQRIVSFNAAAERIFGYPAGCVAGGEAAVLFAPSSDELVGRFFEDQIGTSETRVVRSEGVRRDGTRFPVDLTGSTGRAGGRPLVIAIVRDVTDQERAESLRRRYSQELESKVRESTQHLESALARQSELAQRNAEAYEVVRRTQAELLRRERLAAVGEMAATVAHGLRNPLASIRAAAEVGQEHMSEPSLVRETLGDIVTEASRLEDRIAGVLDFARPVQPSLASGDVNRVVAAFFDDLRSRVPQATRLVLDLEPGIPPIVFDALHLREALGALALNAVETGAGQVTISSALERGENGGSSVTLSVADTGPGIGPNRINQIFDLFYTTKPSRSGVGLTVARRLLEAQGGRLDVSSRPSGTTFLIRLPLRRVAAESGAPSP
jgi:PAS domain S-box-containing protein